MVKQMRKNRRSTAAQRGFSLIELIIVVTIIGILAAVAMVNVRNSVRKARETACRDNLFQMRKAIDNFYADKQRFPTDLNELVPNYIRKVPKDPLTNAEDWEQVAESPDPESALESETDPNAAAQPGVVDVRTSAQGTGLDGTPYSEY
jgi:general secretion pathway protein G